MVVTGVLILKNSILCKKEVLGQTFRSIIKNVEVFVDFPRILPYVETDEGKIDYDLTSDKLLPPECIEEKKISWYKDWGYTIRYPDQWSEVSAIAISFNCDSNNYNEIGEMIYQNTGRWENSFLQYCKLSVKQYNRPARDKKDIISNADLFLYKPEYIHRTTHITLHGYLPSDKNVLSINQIIAALSFAASEKELLLEYQFLLDAYYYIGVGGNRQAIIEAALGVEICVKRQIERYFTSKEIDPEIINRKYRSLGDRLQLIIKLYPALEISQDFIKKRNDVVHPNGKEMSNEDALLYIKTAEKILEFFNDDFYE